MGVWSKNRFHVGANPKNFHRRNRCGVNVQNVYAPIRRMINLKNLNAFIPHLHFTADGLHFVTCARWT